MKLVFNPLTNKFDFVGTGVKFVIYGEEGIKSFRMSSTPSGNLFDITINDSGNLVSTPVEPDGYMLLESGDYHLLENDDKIIIG